MLQTGQVYFENWRRHIPQTTLALELSACA